MHSFLYKIRQPIPKYCISFNTTQFQLSKLALAFLIFNINVNGPDFFNLRELAFILFFFISLPFGNFYKLGNFFIAVFVFLFTSTINCFLPNTTETPMAVIKNVLGFFYLYMFAYDKTAYRETIRNSFLCSTTIVALMIVSMWLVCQFSTNIRNVLSSYFLENKGTKTAFIFMINYRKILKWWVLGVYYGTAPALIPSLGYLLYKNLSNKTKIVNKFIIILHFLALVMTGARANILAGSLLLFIYFCFKLYLRREFLVATLLLTLVVICGLVIVVLFLSDKKEGSLVTKTLHKMSYFREFNKEPLRYFFIGAGGGSSFYSEGYGRYTTLTELTVWETIRRYGLIGTIILFFVLWFNPIIIVLANTLSIKSIYYCIVMLAYVFVACTNPFLFGSIGFLALLFFRNVSNPLLEENK